MILQTSREAASSAEEKSASFSLRAKARKRRIAPGVSFTVFRSLPDGFRPAPGRTPPCVTTARAASK